MKEYKNKTNFEEEKKTAKYSIIFEKFTKLSEKFVQVESSKKVYHEKFKEADREKKEFLKEVLELREKVEVLSKENFDLRQKSATKEKYLIEKIKQMEKRPIAVGDRKRQGKISEDSCYYLDGKVKKMSNVYDEKEENNDVDKEWNEYRLERKCD